MEILIQNKVHRKHLKHTHIAALHNKCQGQVRSRDHRLWRKRFSFHTRTPLTDIENCHVSSSQQRPKFIETPKMKDL